MISWSSKAAGIAVLLCIVTACGQPEDHQMSSKGMSRPNVFTAVRTPAIREKEAPPNIDLASYVGHSPSDDQSRFWNDPAAYHAIREAVGSKEKIALLRSFEVETPFSESNGRLITRVCEQGNCGNGATIRIARDAASAEVCFQDDGDNGGDGKPYWYTKGKLQNDTSNCPSGVDSSDIVQPNTQ